MAGLVVVGRTQNRMGKGPFSSAGNEGTLKRIMGMGLGQEEANLKKKLSEDF